MQNPFKKADAVLTRVKGAVVEANVTQTWNNEVQVKTTMGDVLWRTMYTVWRAGSEPLKRQPKAEPAPATAEHAESATSPVHEAPATSDDAYRVQKQATQTQIAARVSSPSGAFTSAALVPMPLPCRSSASQVSGSEQLDSTVATASM